MKKVSFLLAGMATLFMASCSSDAPDAPQVADRDYQAYLKVAISNPPSDRSRSFDSPDLFEDGNEDENTIEEILFVFYNKSKNYVAHTRMHTTKTGGVYAETTLPDVEEGLGHIEGVINVIVPVDVNAESYLPYYVVAYVNPVSTSPDIIKSNIEGIKNEERTLAEVTKSKKFVMNNSTHYDGTGSTMPTFATVIGDNLKKTSEEADKTAGIDIYIERVAAKVSVSVATNANLDSEKDDVVNGYKLKFTAQGWILNNTEKKTYLIKQFRKSADQTAQMNYSEVTNTLHDDFKTLWSGYSSGADNKHRSYWATSRSYYNGTYPSNTYDVNTSENAESYPLNYYDHNESKLKGFATGDDPKWQYCLENTIDSKILNSSSRKASVTSVVVAGEYALIGSDGKPLKDAAGDLVDFYRLGKTNDKWNVYLLHEMIALMSSSQQSIFVKKQVEGEDKFEPVRMGDDGNITKDEAVKIFDVRHPDGNKSVPERYSYLQLAKTITVDAGKYYYRTVNSDGTYDHKDLKNIQQVERKAIDQELMALYSPAEKYNKGRAYFSIPIKHFGNGNSDFDAENVGVGTYGIVRNHAYKVNITGIDGMGTGIGDPDNPIVIPTQQTSYHVKTRINVLKWHVLKVQNAILGE